MYLLVKCKEGRFESLVDTYEDYKLEDIKNSIAEKLNYNRNYLNSIRRLLVETDKFDVPNFVLDAYDVLEHYILEWEGLLNVEHFYILAPKQFIKPDNLSIFHTKEFETEVKLTFGYSAYNLLQGVIRDKLDIMCDGKVPMDCSLNDDNSEWLQSTVEELYGEYMNEIRAKGTFILRDNFIEEEVNTDHEIATYFQRAHSILQFSDFLCFIKHTEVVKFKGDCCFNSLLTANSFYTINGSAEQITKIENDRIVAKGEVLYDKKDLRFKNIIPAIAVKPSNGEDYVNYLYSPYVCNILDNLSINYFVKTYLPKYYVKYDTKILCSEVERILNSLRGEDNKQLENPINFEII